MTTEAHSPQQPVLVIMGVSGSGTSTVAGILAGQLGWDLEEGDDLHPAANVEKMAAGTPLTDDDRWPWLNRVGSGPRPIWCSWRTGYTSPPRRSQSRPGRPFPRRNPLGRTSIGQPRARSTERLTPALDSARSPSIRSTPAT